MANVADIAAEEEIEYEGLPGGSLVSNLAAGAFAGIMVFTIGSLLRCCADDIVRNIPSCIPLMRSR